MTGWLRDHAGFLFASLGVFVYFTIATWETLAPDRPVPSGQGRRWTRAASIHTIGLVATGVCFPFAASTVVDWAHLHQIGLFNYLQLPAALSALAGVLLLDLGNYFAHRVMHAVPVLWRIHQVHHSDLALDCATDLLHHPVEVVIVGVLYFAQLLIWGVPYESVLGFALLGILVGPWQHGNLRLPRPLQETLRMLVVTPEMHRVHHSSVARDGNRNYSVIFPWWDRCFATYATQPRDGWPALRFGLAELQSPNDVTFFKLLLKPLTALRPRQPDVQ